MENKKRVNKIGLIVSILLFIVGVGTTFAAYSYNRSGTVNSKQIVGDIYMHYRENNVLTLENAMPSNTYDSSKYFEFTIAGKNTYTKKDIVYDIVLNHGDDSTDENRTIRIRDELLRFRLVEVVNNEEQEIFTDRSYIDFNNMRIHKEIISKNTTSEIAKTYRIYMWISNDTIIGNTSEADYSIEDWNKVYASLKVNVTGDFQEKEVLKPLYDVVKTNAVMDNITSDYVTNQDGIHFYEISSDTNGKGVYTRAGTENDQNPIYYYRGNVDNNNVIFANKCWKIVRTTETGGTKMIYNGEQSPVYSKEFTDLDTYVSENDGDILTFDSTDNTWNYEVSDGSNREISFKVPAGDNYSIVATGTTGSTCGGGLRVYKDGVQVNGTSNGGGNPINYSYSYGTLSSSNVLKIVVNGSGSSTCGITVKMYIQQGTTKLSKNDYSVLMQKDSGTLGCDNTGNSSQLPSQAWNPSYKSPAYVGYNYGTTQYEVKYEVNSANWTSGAKFGSSYTWNGTSYTLVDATETTPNATHHYSCNATNSDATCSDLRYVYYVYYTGGSIKYYLTLQNGKGVEDALKEMLSESTDTIKSPIHETINNWYNTNIKNSYGTYVEDTAWCNDRSIGSIGGWNPNGGALTGSSWTDYSLLFSSYTRYRNPTGTNGIQTTNSPVLTCSNPNDVMSVANRKLENPVALLTYDEANLVGLIYSSANNSNYLLTGNDYWLLSPAGLNNGGASVCSVSDYYLNNNYNNSFLGVRPALSLKHGTLVYDGDGTVDNPYIVESEN